MARFLSLDELFKGRHFDWEVVVLCVRWHLRFKLSYRDLIETMAERGLLLAHTCCTTPSRLCWAGGTRLLSWKRRAKSGPHERADLVALRAGVSCVGGPEQARSDAP